MLTTISTSLSATISSPVPHGFRAAPSNGPPPPLPLETTSASETVLSNDCPLVKRRFFNLQALSDDCSMVKRRNLGDKLMHCDQYYKLLHQLPAAEGELVDYRGPFARRCCHCISTQDTLQNPQSRGAGPCCTSYSSTSCPATAVHWNIKPKMPKKKGRRRVLYYSSLSLGSSIPWRAKTAGHHLRQQSYVAVHSTSAQQYTAVPQRPRVGRTKGHADLSGNKRSDKMSKWCSQLNASSTKAISPSREKFP